MIVNKPLFLDKNIVPYIFHSHQSLLKKASWIDAGEENQLYTAVDDTLIRSGCFASFVAQNQLLLLLAFLWHHNVANQPTPAIALANLLDEFDTSKWGNFTFEGEKMRITKMSFCPAIE